MCSPFSHQLPPHRSTYSSHPIYSSVIGQPPRFNTPCVLILLLLPPMSASHDPTVITCRGLVFNSSIAWFLLVFGFVFCYKFWSIWCNLQLLLLGGLAKLSWWSRFRWILPRLWRSASRWSARPSVAVISRSGKTRWIFFLFLGFVCVIDCDIKGSELACYLWFWLQAQAHLFPRIFGHEASGFVLFKCLIFGFFGYFCLLVLHSMF